VRVVWFRSYSDGVLGGTATPKKFLIMSLVFVVGMFVAAEQIQDVNKYKMTITRCHFPQL
jgi:hypothetical protein